MAIVGPPNSGKSTLFNRLTGLRQKVANFPGVTVEHRMGKVKLDQGREVFVVDLPGVYSLTPRTEDERVTHDVLSGQMKDMPAPDAVLLILDSTNLGRHLVLAAPVLSLGLPTLVILNMADDLKSRGGEVNVAGARHAARLARGAGQRRQGNRRRKDFPVPQRSDAGAAPSAPLMQLPVIQDIPKCRAWAANVGNKTGYHAPAPPLWTRRLDAFFLHPVAGPLVFLMRGAWRVFQTIFSGREPADGRDRRSDQTLRRLDRTPASERRPALAGGRWRLERRRLGGRLSAANPACCSCSSASWKIPGYLARAALIADRTMARFGLQGKSFIPLLSAYACAVPAIMATRTIENKRDRIATILIAPFMTCSARLPGLHSDDRAPSSPRETSLGVVPRDASRSAAGSVRARIPGRDPVTARLLKSTVLKSRRSSFMLEMPPYRWPTRSQSWRCAWWTARRSSCAARAP